MTSSSSANYISVLAFRYIPPIATLLAQLESSPQTLPNPVQTSPADNGYSIATIALTVLMVESAIARTQYDLKITPPQRPLPFLNAHFPGDPIVAEVEELFVLRDAIAHNHLWEATVSWAPTGNLSLISASLVSGYGDAKLTRVIQLSTRTTKLLGLNLFPTRICRSDAVLTLKTAVRFIQFLEQAGHKLLDLPNQYVLYQGDLKPFPDIVAALTP